MPARSITSPDDQTVTFVELFFDLVFVFSVTQVVGLLHHDLSPAGVGQAALVFWLVWWAWTQFTWTLNAADTTHSVVALATLGATGVAFFMGVALPDVFQGGAMWFAAPYALVRLIGLVFQLRAAREDPAQDQRAAETFALVSVGGIAAVLAGAAAGGAMLYWLWGLAILLDLSAATVSSQREGWNLHPEHFAERHGLFVIIALGETLIGVGGIAAESRWTGHLVATTLLAVAFSCGLWWTYFPRVHPAIEHAMKAQLGRARAALARDVYSLSYFPILGGVIAYAVAAEEAVAHPSEPLALASRLALAFGILLFVGGMAGAVWRATGQILWSRVILSVSTAALVVVVDGSPSYVSLVVATAGVVAVAAVEHPWGRPLRA